MQRAIAKSIEDDDDMVRFAIQASLEPQGGGLKRTGL